MLSVAVETLADFKTSYKLKIIRAMEIKILVKENEKIELDKFIKTCKEHGMKLTREGGGRLPNFSGYYSVLEGVRWQKHDTSSINCNIPLVSGSVLTDVDYWKIRCKLSEAIEAASPCDPDITTKQINAYSDYNKFIERYGTDR